MINIPEPGLFRLIFGREMKWRTQGRQAFHFYAGQILEHVTLLEIEPARYPYPSNYFIKVCLENADYYVSIPCTGGHVRLVDLVTDEVFA